MNNEVDLFAFGVLIVIVPIIFALFFTVPKHEEFKIDIVTTTIEPVIKQQPITYNSEKFNQAKQILQSIGFSATEAKDLLKKSGPNENVDEWVKCAMRMKEI